MNSIIIAIAGGTGSGKTYLSRNILKLYPKGNILIIEQDSYYKDISTLNFKMRSEQNFDHPSAIDSKLLAMHLQKLLDGKSIQMPQYDFSRHLKMKKTKSVKQHCIIIVEGILMLHYIKLHKFYTLKIFIDTPEDTRIIRRMDRDINERGRTEKSINAQYFATVKPMHEKFVEPSKAHADIIINGMENINYIANQIKTNIDSILG